jgi:hypothetical protein
MHQTNNTFPPCYNVDTLMYGPCPPVLRTFVLEATFYGPYLEQF